MASYHFGVYVRYFRKKVLYKDKENVYKFIPNFVYDFSLSICS